MTAAAVVLMGVLAWLEHACTWLARPFRRAGWLGRRSLSRFTAPHSGRHCPKTLPPPREDESATEWLARTGVLDDAAEHLAAMIPEIPAPPTPAQDEAATTTSAPPVDAARLPLRATPPSGAQGQPSFDVDAFIAETLRGDWQETRPPPIAPVRRDTWVLTQPPPGSPLGFTPVGIRRPATTPNPAVVTAPQPALSAAEALGVPGPVYRWQDDLPDLVRPWLALTGTEDDSVRRCVWADPAQWIRDRDKAGGAAA